MGERTLSADGKFGLELAFPTQIQSLDLDQLPDCDESERVSGR